MYFGLQTGWISMMSLQSSLLGFAIFKPLQGRLKTPFGPVENVVLQTTAVATATMPLAGGFVGIIPALGMLEESEGRVVLSVSELILWGMGIAFFGVFFAVPLRKQVIIKEQLPFPSGTATAQMISVLHRQKDISVSGTSSGAHHRAQDSLGAHEMRQRHGSPNSTGSATSLAEADWSQKLRALLVSFGISSVYTLLAHFIPVLNALPLGDWITGGTVGFSQWNWYLTPALSYVGQGVIMGLPTTLAMLAGAILGWGVLGPLSKAEGWAPGPINDQKTGPRGWILWVSLAIMISESLVGLGVILIKEVTRRFRQHRESRAERAKTSRNPSLLEGNLPATRVVGEEDVPISWLVPSSWTYSGLIVSSILCIFISSYLFHVAWYASIVSVVLACLLSVLAVRALGETDMNPVSGIGKVSQVVIAGLVPGGLVANLVAGGIAEAGAQQAGDMMQDLKTGHLIGASPRAQFWGQLIGSFFSVLISVAAYTVYTTVYPIPGPDFQVPTAYVWLDMARLVNGHALPTNTTPFIIAFALLAAIPPLLELAFPNRTWHRWIPSGVAFAIGMMITPNYTLPRVIGALLGHFAMRHGMSKIPDGSDDLTVEEEAKRKSRRVLVIVVASGLVLGEGTFSLVNMILTSAHVGAATCLGCLPGLCGECS
ncbi:OPT oligopeptide transporter protein-domain-containing protein [Piptocephalis cylindrospora]|uniref:OPT oligopeptide transporter protein-domain-containing protein n=1 Tax=Piptocephalis cylindrospora TaxID=1907219 RepID=A0A4P9Y1A4_9FUNG|nr:OPT oligopeptide transporter protein-domain-containing protein [Piptocephalis cylindrospora]|eukprot:RKP12454.1 OPT oligopeptide transporter protein-domain-containing protein [Piptocephalis cylindrospora]